MIKTLRITSYFAVVLAVAFFAFPAVFGVRGDKQIEQFLNSTGAIEQFKGAKVKGSRQEISPLVKQAEAFALYLNPPPKPEPVASDRRDNRPRPASVAPKFRLVGTSRHEVRPELSLALIDEPGKGLHWVRQASKVGHLIIEQVKDGLVVVRDGENTFEVVAERLEKRSLLKANTSSGRITDSNPAEIDTEVEISAEEAAELMKEAEAANEKMMAEMDAMLASAKQDEAEQKAEQANVEAGETDGDAKNEEGTTAEKRPVSNLETMRISTREAKRLGRLGRRLRDVQRQPNQADNNNRAESDANVNEPNSNDVNVPP